MRAGRWCPVHKNGYDDCSFKHWDGTALADLADAMWAAQAAAEETQEAVE